MKVILEKKDLVTLLGRALRRNLTVAEVEVHADPFEVVIHDAEGVLGDMEPDHPQQPPPPNAVPSPVERTPVPSPIVMDEDGSLEDLQVQSAALASRPPRTTKADKTKKVRPLMPGESTEPRNPLHEE